MTKNTESTEMTVVDTLRQAPATVEQRTTRVGQGSENVTAADMAIPRLKLLQKISPECEKGNAQYIEAAEPGLIMNSVTNELSAAMFCVNLHYSKKVMVWRKRKFGSGIFGGYDTEAQARVALEEAKENVEHYDIVENPTHLLMLLSNEGHPKGVVLLDMPTSKAKVSNKWNTMIAEKEQEGHPRFGCVWQLSTVSQSSPNGSFDNYAVEFVTVAPDNIYAAAEAAFDNFFGNRVQEAA